MKVESILRSEVRHVAPTTDLATAGRLMAEVGCGILPVLEASGKLAGVLTDRDICVAVTHADRRPSELTAGRVMSRQVRACAIGDEIGRALETMARFRVRRLPVLAPDGTLRGLLSIDDIAVVAHDHAAEPLPDLTEAAVARTFAAICAHPIPALVS
jgi:CBS domain-containing protein